MHYYSIFQVKYILGDIDGFAFTMEAYVANIGWVSCIISAFHASFLLCRNRIYIIYSIYMCCILISAVKQLIASKINVFVYIKMCVYSINLIHLEDGMFRVSQTS